ncbi:MAG: hypothetical protein LBH03_04510 [Holophagales bacterium]|jgi:DNA-binding protein Fis|nr:hypothetical protein [Holophagales bacterium]
MFRHNLLKIQLFTAAALFCACLTAADDLKIAIQEPRGSSELRNLVKGQFTSVVTKTRGFQLFDRANTDQIIAEHDQVRTSGLYSDAEVRGLGEFKGADFVIISELTMLNDGVMQITGQAINIVTGRVVGAETKLVTSQSSKSISDACQDLMESLLKQVNVSMSGRNPADTPQSIMNDMEGEIRRVLMNNRSNAKWNANRNSYSLEIDLSGVTIDENLQFRTSKVSGRIYFMLTDQNGDGSNAELELQSFTEIGKTLIQKKIRDQVQQKVNNIIRDLLSGLD